MKVHILTSYLLVLLFFLAFPGLAAAQENSFNLNSERGLPSNKVYGMITDRNGYLWISTDKGIVKYNGYECKLFTQSEGLPKNDIWELLEDKKGRIWIGNLSDEMGYIYNNRYHKVHLKDISTAIYPFNINLYDSGIFFSSSNINNRPGHMIFMDRNDTLLHLYVADSLFLPETNGALNIILGTGQRTLAAYGRYLFTLNDIKNAIYKTGKIGIGKKIAKGILDTNEKIAGGIKLLYGDWYLEYIPDKKSTKVYALNLRTSYLDSMSIKAFGIDEPIEYVNFNKAKINEGVFIYTQRHVIQIFPEEGFEKYKLFSLDSLLNVERENIKTISFAKDPLWGSFIGTTQKGVFIHPDNSCCEFIKSQVNLAEYKHFGVNNHLSFWWNVETRNLIKLENGVVTAHISLPSIRQINNIIQYSPDTCLILGPYSYFLDLRSHLLSSRNIWKSSNNLINVIPSKSGKRFLLSRTGFYRSDAADNLAPGEEKKFIHMDLFIDMTFDSTRQKIWVFSENKILKFDPLQKTKEEIFNKASISALGISNLEKMCIDGKFGNIYLKGTESLVAFDYEKNTHKEILKNINMKNAIVDIFDGVLVVSGSFGILFCKILGKQSISKPIIFYNTKKRHYDKVADMAHFSGTVLLNTDAGVYHVAMPSERSYYRKERPYVLPYKIVMSNSIAPRNIHNGDTLIIEQNDRKLLLDVINPLGNGTVTYYYRKTDDSVWSKLNSNEISFISAYEPDHYYTLYFYATDDAWKSDVIKNIVYVRPFWWQTRSAKRLTWIGSSLFGLFIIFISVYITRRIVLRAATRKNLQMEMELKSIYAQINPHFIFNSLNSALLLVSKNKMDDAYMHISKFSRLLRSYLKSSRNKYITVAEEVENLKNYIELQQTRFKNKFDYQIVVGPLIYQQKLMIPSLLLQPFVENAINHGILLKEEKSNLVVEFMFNAGNNEMICVIDDDGIGRKQAKLNNVSMEGKTESYGNLMIKDLVNIFNRYEDMQIDISYCDKEPPLAGTSVVITIKRPHAEQKLR